MLTFYLTTWSSNLGLKRYKNESKKFPLLGYKMPRSSSSQTKPPILSQRAPAFTNPYSSVGAVVPHQPTLGQSIKQGLGFGAGSAIAHRFLNPFPSVYPTDDKAEEACKKERLAFEMCMKTKSVEDFCGEQQMGYTKCLRISKGLS